MNRRTTIIVAAAFVIGLGVAVFSGGSGRNPGSTRRTITLPPAGGPLSSGALGKIDPGQHPDFTAVERGQAVLSLLEGAAPGQMVALFSRARNDGIEGRLVAKRWAEIDPLGFLTFLDNNPEEGEAAGNDYRQILFETWAASDPSSALAAADEAGRQRRDALKSIFAVLMHSDPEAGFRYIEQHPDQFIPIDYSAMDWTKTNSEEYARRLVALPKHNNYRNLALRLAAEAWFDQNPTAALEFLAGLGGDPSHARPGALNNWSAKDPIAAAEYVANEVMGPDRYIAANGVVRGWAKTDPQAAMDWIEANLWGASRRHATKLLLTEVAEYSPEGVLEFLDAMPPTDLRHEGYAALARAWVQKDSDAAMAWAQAIESPRDRERLFAALANGWIDGGSWKQGGRYVAQHANPEEIPVGFTREIGKKWGSHFPFEALKWVNTLPPEHAGAASRGVFGAWTRQNVGPVILPLNGLPEGEIRSNAHAAVAGNYFRKNFNKAAQWYQTLEAPDREAVLGGLSSSQRKRLENLPAE